MFPWLVGGWILRQKGQPSFPIVLKHRGDLGVSADADRVISAAGIGIGSVDAKEFGLGEIFDGFQFCRTQGFG
jgi:hypothetical protein